MSKPILQGNTLLKALDEIYKIYHPSAAFDSNLETMKSASGKRHTGEKHNPGEETNKPQQRSEVCGK